MDLIHKTTTNLINQFDIIYLEDLNVKGMMKNHKLAKAIGDVSWGKFIDTLEYKSLWNDNQIIHVRSDPAYRHRYPDNILVENINTFHGNRFNHCHDYHAFHKDVYPSHMVPGDCHPDRWMYTFSKTVAWVS